MFLFCFGFVRERGGILFCREKVREGTFVPSPPSPLPPLFFCFTHTHTKRQLSQCRLFSFRCASVPIIVHELAHNLGLAHASRTPLPDDSSLDATYGDWTDFMGNYNDRCVTCWRDVRKMSRRCMT